MKFMGFLLKKQKNVSKETSDKLKMLLQILEIQKQIVGICNILEKLEQRITILERKK